MTSQKLIINRKIMVGSRSWPLWLHKANRGSSFEARQGGIAQVIAPELQTISLNFDKKL